MHVFSGHKTYQELKALTAELVDENGTLRTFSQFKDAVSSLNQLFNVSYLQAEYNLAVASSQMAEKWTGFEKEKDTFPLLKYKTVGDAVVRDSHAALDDIIQPVDSDFWDQHYPPNGWNCRCTVTQLADGTESDVSNIPESSGMFKNNVGKTGIIFPDNHPYFKVDREDKSKVKKQIEKLKDGE